MGLWETVLDLMYWTMLAASTVGPGTIIMMAKSGAEFQLHLCWVIIFASIVAFATQEGAARLYIVSGYDLGGAIQAYFRSPLVNHVLALSIVVANCAPEGGEMIEEPVQLDSLTIASSTGVPCRLCDAALNWKQCCDMVFDWPSCPSSFPSS